MSSTNEAVKDTIRVTPTMELRLGSFTKSDGSLQANIRVDDGRERNTMLRFVEAGACSCDTSRKVFRLTPFGKELLQCLSKTTAKTFFVGEKHITRTEV